MSIKDVYNIDDFRAVGHEVVDLMADYLQKAIKGTDMPVMNWKAPDTQFDYWDSYAIKGKSTTEFFEDILSNSIHIHHPKYIGHQVSAPAPLTALADMLSSLLNNGMAIYEMGPAASALEKWIAIQFGKRIGYDAHSSGFLTSGGSLGTLTALLAARQNMSDQNVWEDGLSQKLGIMVSGQSHYSVDRAVRIMGLGASGIIKIPTNDQFQMRPDLLKESLIEAEKNGVKVIAVVANACSTATGTYDDLNAIGDFCRRNNLWFHVDAAHGGGVLFSEKYKHLLSGIRNADSVIIDLHKMLMNPALSTMVMFKDGRTSYETFNQEAQYLWEQEDEEWFNYAKRTMECTKLMMSLKFYTMVNAYGFEVFDEHVTSLYDLSSEFAEMIEMHPKFEIAIKPMANIVCFRYRHAIEGKSLNETNKQIRKTLLEDGEFYIVQTEIDDTIYLRASLMNPFTTRQHLEELLVRIEQTAEVLNNK